MIKVEIYQDTALLLDYQGRVWQVRIGYDGQPEMQEIERVSHSTIEALTQPQLARFLK